MRLCGVWMTMARRRKMLRLYRSKSIYKVTVCPSINVKGRLLQAAFLAAIYLGGTASFKHALTLLLLLPLRYGFGGEHNLQRPLRYRDIDHLPVERGGGETLEPRRLECVQHFDRL